MEGRQLYWGTMPFHIGISFLFLGHLIAFLFPNTLIAWNSQPVRLIILELSAFVFGLSCLIGVFMLFKRRLMTKRIRVVSNYMDYIVLGLLLIQIISGLCVAFFDRWGSSWFAAVLTPYLRSLFVFKPTIDAVQTLPLSIKLHIISAISIIAIIPFTRLVHFLVPPINYIWRDYQQVIWNKKG